MTEEAPDTAQQATKRGPFFGALTFALVALTVLALAEAALQLREYLHRRQAHAAASDLNDNFVVHPFLQVAPKPDPSPEVFVNDHGFRGPPIEEARRPGTLRIFSLGGSTTFSASVDYAKTYPAQLERLLESRAPHLDVEIQNASCDWYSSEHSLIRYLFHVRRFKPDVVLVFHGVNDLYRSFAPEWFSNSQFRPDYGHYLGPLVRAERARDIAAWFPFEHSMLLKTFNGFFAADAPFDAQQVDPFEPGIMWTLRDRQTAKPVENFPSLPIFRENLGLLVAALQRDGVDLVLATQPSLYRADLDAADRNELVFAPFLAGQAGSYPDLESMERGMALFNAATRDLAQTEGITLVDLDAAIPRTKVQFIDDVHMRPAALGAVAGEFADAIEAAGYLEPADSGLADESAPSVAR